MLISHDIAKKILAFRRAFSDPNHPEDLLALIRIITGRSHQYAEILTPYHILNDAEMQSRTDSPPKSIYDMNQIYELRAIVDGELYRICFAPIQNYIQAFLLMFDGLIETRMERSRELQRTKDLDNSPYRTPHFILIADLSIQPDGLPIALTMDQDNSESNTRRGGIDVRSFYLQSEERGATTEQLQLQQVFKHEPIIGEPTADICRLQRRLQLQDMDPAEQRSFDFQVDELAQFIAEIADHLPPLKGDGELFF